MESYDNVIPRASTGTPPKPQTGRTSPSAHLDDMRQIYTNVCGEHYWCWVWLLWVSPDYRPFIFSFLYSISTCMHTDLLTFKQIFSLCNDCKVSFSFVGVLYYDWYIWDVLVACKGHLFNQQINMHITDFQMKQWKLSHNHPHKTSSRKQNLSLNLSSWISGSSGASQFIISLDYMSVGNSSPFLPWHSFF